MTMHHYTECGLQNIFLVNGYQEMKTPYGRAVAVDDIDGLHALIGVELANRPSDLSKEEFRFLRTELDLTQAALARLTGTKVQNISNWERGVRELPPAAERTVRALYLEKVKGAVEFMDLLQHLADEDARTAEPANEQLEFEMDESAWRARAA